MLYYGRWSYKLEEARRRGAAGCLIIHFSHLIWLRDYAWLCLLFDFLGDAVDFPAKSVKTVLEAFMIAKLSNHLSDCAVICVISMLLRSSKLRRWCWNWGEEFAGYPWSVTQTGYKGEKVSLEKEQASELDHASCLLYPIPKKHEHCQKRIFSFFLFPPTAKLRGFQPQL